MRSLSLIAASISLLIVIHSAPAMPPLRGGHEPHYPTGVNAPNRSLISRDQPALEGEWNCLVILIDFPDYPWDNQNDSNFANQGAPYDSDHFSEMLFSEGAYRHPGSASDYTGSMHDYYSEISGGAFTTNGVVTHYYRAPHNYNYYCNYDGQDSTDDDYGFGEYPHNAQRLVENAINAADADIDFSNFDNDGDGWVDGLFVIHSGPGAEEIPGAAGAIYLWSHKWGINPQDRDNVTLSGYTLEPENGSAGVFCHEFGHALGLPDLYDTDESSEGVGEWCLMGAGGWNYRPGDPPGTCPAHMCAWSKMKLGWADVVNVDSTLQDVEIPPVENGGRVWRLWTHGAEGNEYYLLENRRRIGFDAGLVRRQMDYNLAAPEGLLILHADDSLDNNENDAHRLLDVEEASGVIKDGQYYENLDGRRIRPADRNLYNPNRADNGDLWPGFTRTSEDSTDWIGARSKDRFSSISLPSSYGYSGAPSFVAVTNIHLDAENVVCDLSVQEADAPLLALDSVAISDSEGGNGNTFLEPGETATVTVRLHNFGMRRASNVEMTASYQGPLQVTVSPANGIVFMDINPGESELGQPAFRIGIPQDAPQVGTIVLDCDVLCNDTLHFAQTIQLDIRPPHEWLKYYRNPVLVASVDDWDAEGIISIAVSSEGDTVKCWYVAGSATLDSVHAAGVGYAYSLDGGFTWSVRPEPLITHIDRDWAAGGIRGLGIYPRPEGSGYLMMFLASDATGAALSIGRAVSDDGFSWQFDEQPALQPSGWVSDFFPVGQLTILWDGAHYRCGFAASTAATYVAMGSATSDDLVHWTLVDQPDVSPTLNPTDFDGYVCASPDFTTNQIGSTVLYTGFTNDIVGRLGIIVVTEGPVLTRHRGFETGGSVLEPEAHGWEAGGMMIGGRLFDYHGTQRMLYVVAGAAPGAVGLAGWPTEMSAPKEGTPSVTQPATILLDPAYPNPFNGATRLTYNLAADGLVRLGVYDLAGRQITELVRSRQTAGEHRAVWQSSAAPTGMYFLRLEAGGEVRATKLMLIK